MTSGDGRGVFCRWRGGALRIAFFAATACSSGDKDQDAESSPTAPTGPQAGAPDEHCELDPARVYLIEHPHEHIASAQLTDLEDPSILCAFRDGYREHIRLDPLDGSLIALHGAVIWRVNPDWMEPNGPGSSVWVPAFDGEDNDEELGRVLLSLDITCKADNPLVLLTDDVNVFASCGGMWFNAPQIEGYSDWRHLVGLVDGRKIYKGLPFTMSGYFTDDPDQVPLQPIGMPAGIDALEHLAVRPIAGTLLAAVQVWRGDVVTTEQARVDANGVTLTGTYAHDIGEAGVPWMDYALAADGTIFGVEILPIDALGEDGPRRIVRMTMGDAPEVIMTTTFYDEDRPPRLVAVGAGGPTPSGE